MSDAEIDAFPLGIVRLDTEGVVQLLNAAGERLFHRHASAVGQNYFRDLAPWPSLRELERRFRRFVASADARHERFGFFYPSDWDHREVLITMLKRGDCPWIYLIVDVRAVTE